MFTKKPDKEPTAFDLGRTTPPAPPSGPMPTAMPTMGRPASSKGGESRIGSDLAVIGNLVSKGEIQIDGEVQGDIHAANIIVGESARITGGLVAEEIIVRGTVMGSIRGKRVVLQSSSKVEGDIFHSQLAIEQGAFFEGKSRRMDDPTAGVQRPEVPLPAGINGAAS
ncbi:MAG: polymer-forming cytoskeletal protein [Proteobacteria bacterium]|nr:polymer-forming cytoskeletal protein [Pseudomonadota bacterium]